MNFSIRRLVANACPVFGVLLFAACSPVLKGTADPIGGGDTFTAYLYQVRDNVLLPAVDAILAGSYTGNLCDYSACEGSSQKICRRLPVLSGEQRVSCHGLLLSRLREARAKLVDPAVTLIGVNESFQTEHDRPLMMTSRSASGPIRASRTDIGALDLDEHELAALLFHEYLHKTADPVSGGFPSDEETIGAFTGPLGGSAALTAAGYAVALQGLRAEQKVAGSVPPVRQHGTNFLFVTGGLRENGSAYLELANPASLVATASQASRNISFPSFTQSAPSAVVAGDIVGDGVKRIVVADQEGRLRVFDANGIALPTALPAYPMGDTYRSPLSLAVGDVTGDGRPELIVGPAGPNPGTRIRIFDGSTGLQIREMTPYSPEWGGGVSLAAADVNGDGIAEILTGAGPGGGPHVRLFDGATGNVLSEAFAYSAAFTGGVNVALGDTDGDGVPEIITGAGPGGGPHVRVLKALTFQPVLEFFAWSPSFTDGARVAAGDVNGDGKADILVAPARNMSLSLKVFSGASGALLSESATLVAPSAGSHFGLFFGQL